MESICHLNCLRRAGRHTLGITTGPVSGDNLDSWMLLQPCSERLGLATIEHIHGTVAFEIAEEGSISLTPAQGSVVDTQHVQW